MTSIALTERTDRLALPLDERARRIIGIVEQAAIDVGRELIAAKAEHPGAFMAWVEAELPFGVDKAERLMAITRAFETADEDMMQALPSAYSALYELSRMPTTRLRQAIDAGEVTPDSTVRECRDMNREEPLPPARPRIGADIVAGELVRFRRSELSDDAARRLRRWLG